MSHVQDLTPETMTPADTVLTTQVQSPNVGEIAATVVEPVAFQTVPGGRARRLLPAVEVEAEAVVEVPAHAQEGLFDFTPQQQFVVVGCMIITSTYTFASMLALMLP